MNPQRDEFHESPSSHAIRHERLILFTRYPVPGRVKTRLIPTLGPEGAARLQRRLTLCALRSAEALRARFGIDVEIHFDGASESSMRHWLGDRFGFWPQVEGDLGRRMAGAFEKSFRVGTQAVVIIGADCPELTPDILAEAFSRLRQHPVVLGPSKDGGYYLIGLRQPTPQLFLGVEWGTGTVLASTLQILEELDIRPFLLGTLNDIDRPEDLLAWRRVVNASEADLNQISVIIPTRNEAENINSTVATAAEGKPLEIIVVDGASSDRTAELAREAGATVLHSQSGRARQMNAGASKAAGNVLLFLHADTLLPRNYSSFAAQHLLGPGVVAGAFRFAVSHAFAGSKFLEWTTNLRSRWLQMPYGDQGLFLRRSLFEELGGFADLPILEDYELVRRLRGCGRVTTVREPVLTSARRWQRLGVLRATLINHWMIAGYHLGWPIKRLAAAYGVRDTI
jgi:rSAM/selenodomain-associated transferase 2/rSAM/selenodomain-associated transferase 1